MLEVNIFSSSDVSFYSILSHVLDSDSEILNFLFFLKNLTSSHHLKWGSPVSRLQSAVEFHSPVTIITAGLYCTSLYTAHSLTMTTGHVNVP